MKLRVARKVMKSHHRLGTFLRAARRMGWGIWRVPIVSGLSEFQSRCILWVGPR